MRIFFAFIIILFLECYSSLSVKAQIYETKASDLNVITLSESIHHAILTNPDLESFAKNIELAEENINLAKSNFRPNINITGDVSHTRSEDNVLIDRDGITSKAFALNVQQPIYRGGQTVAEVKEQSVLKAVTEDQLETLAQNLIVEVTEAYMESYGAILALNVKQNNVDLLSEERNATKARFDAGELTRTDTSQAESRLAEAQAILANAKALHQTVLANLEALTGLTEIESLIYPEIEDGILPLTIDEAIEVGINNNPSILSAESQILAQNYNIEQQKGVFKPQLAAGASAGYDDNPSFGQSEAQQSATVSLNASMPLYQGGVLRSQLRQAKILKNQAKADLEAVKREVKNNIIAAWENYHSASAQIAARESQLEASQIAFNGVSLEEEVGARSVLDVLDANQDLREAELALIDAQTDRVNAYYRLLGAIGLLRESFLG